MTFEEEIAQLNQAYFFKEFTYSNTAFRQQNEDNIVNEVELADSVVWLGNELIIFQLKERFAPTPTTPEQEETWFNRQVLGKATKQIRDTLGYLENNTSIPLENHRGHHFELVSETIETMHKLVIYKAAPELRNELVNKKYHQSRTAGIIHFINTEDYKEIIQTLLTPAEFSDYLSYRQGLIERWAEHVNTVPEQSLVGHYIAGHDAQRPEVLDAGILTQIDHDIESWDISGIVSLYADRIIDIASPTDYYTIITELAKLKRSELKEFKQRYMLSIEKARLNEPITPYRIALPRLGCGFVFIPLDDEMIQHQPNIIQNLTWAHKHDQQLETCIGMTFARYGQEQFDVGWYFIQEPWQYDEEIESFVNEINPFREVRVVQPEAYTFRDNEEG